MKRDERKVNLFNDLITEMVNISGQMSKLEQDAILLVRKKRSYKRLVKLKEVTQQKLDKVYT